MAGGWAYADNSILWKLIQKPYGSQGQTERAVVLQEEEEEFILPKIKKFACFKTQLQKGTEIQPALSKINPYGTVA
jgi:hypothetical protein